MFCKLGRTQRTQESSTISPEVRPEKGNASNASRLAIGPMNARRSPPGHAQSASRRVSRVGLPSVPKGKGGSCSWDGHAGRLSQPGDSGSSPQRDVHLHQGAPGVLDVAGRKIDFLAHTGASYSVLISHTGLFPLKAAL